MPKKGARRFGKPKKPLACEQQRKCLTCGKTLAPGVRYCVSCGTHDETELDSQIADLDEQVKKSRQRTFMELWLARLSFGLWRF